MLREGRAPVWDRLLTMLFLAGLLHGLIILGLTFNASAGDKGSAPGLEVLLVSDELPESDRNDSATYLAQRTQVGSGNTQQSVAPRNRATAVPVPHHAGTPDGDSLADAGDAAASPDERVLTTTAWNTQVRYLGEDGSSAALRSRPLLLDQPPVAQPGPEDEAGPATLKGPQREELWVTPDTRAATLAPYLDAWRRKVERIGTLNYPTVARVAGVRREPGGRSRHRRGRRARSGRDQPLERQRGARPGRARDTQARKSLRPVSARVVRALPRVALCLRVAVRRRPRRQRQGFNRSLRLTAPMPILVTWPASTAP